WPWRDFHFSHSTPPLALRMAFDSVAKARCPEKSFLTVPCGFRFAKAYSHASRSSGAAAINRALRCAIDHGKSPFAFLSPSKSQHSFATECGCGSTFG